jgi:O-antigen ligase
MSASGQDTVRRGAVCALALAVSLPIALISLSKLALLCTFVWLLAASPDMRRSVIAKSLGLHRLIYVAMAAFALSALWSSGSGAAIGKSLSQHGNLLILPLVFFLSKTRRDSVIALQVFMVGQMVLLLGTWALYLNLPVPWAQIGQAHDGTQYAVFSTYLDQSIMTAVFGAVVWHLRELIPARIRTATVALASGLAIGAVFGIFIGRTGYVLATALVSLAIYWELPSRWRLAALLVPLALAVLISLVAPQAQQRALLVKTEVTALMRGASPDAGETSSGVRMNFWKNSLLAIQKQPWIGHGVGSWSSQYDALQPASALPGYVATAGNPHQEYLLWGVELGLPGLALLLGIFVAVWRLSNSFEQQARRAAQSVLAATMVACLFNCALLDALIGDFLCMSLALVLNFGLHPAALADKTQTK